MLQRHRLHLLCALLLVSGASLARPVVVPGASVPEHTELLSLVEEGEGDWEGEPADPTTPVRGGWLRYVLPLAASAALVLAYRWRSNPRLQRRVTMFLGGCALLALGNYTDFGRWHQGSYVNDWEHFHYHLGSRYLPELGYTRLYEAALIADAEDGLRFDHPKGMIRDLVTAGAIRVEDVLARREEVRAHFSDERWAEFVADVRHFESSMSPFQWNHVFHDKGYNATPSWSAYVRLFTEPVRASNELGSLFLSLIDPLLLLTALVAVGRTFGARTAFLAVILIGTHMATSHTHFKGALLRTDWVAALVLAVCALKSGRPFTGGALAALAASSRVFPAFFALGLFARVALALVRRERPDRSSVRFVLGFVGAITVLAGAALVAVGPAHCLEWVEKIRQHNDSFSPWRVGFKHVFLGAHGYLPEGTHQAVFHARQGAWWAVQGTMLTAFVIIGRRMASWELYALGFVPTFFLVAPTYYYYMMLVVPLLFFAGRWAQPECMAGVLTLFVGSCVAHGFHDQVGRELPLFYALSVVILAAGLLMGFSAYLETRPTCQARRTGRLHGKAEPADPHPRSLGV